MGSIVVSGLGKAYKKYSSRWARLSEWFMPGKSVKHTLKWILQDVNFEVKPGEAVGIIGMNGAGKSTLLKMITGTTQPTSGSIHIEGKVAALLELGMGFHPDFTGRQNVYMAGQLLGHSVDTINSLMSDIEGFAEIGEYIDQPVRVYSSGMQMRLAFSVATAVRPDVLIVDEALSVGDAYFQHKSFDRIRQYSKLGTTLLLVSHDKQAIQSICDKAVLLNAGQVAMIGEPESVMDYYNALLADFSGNNVEQKLIQDGVVQTISGTGEVKINDITLLNKAGKVAEVINVGEFVRLKISGRAGEEIPSVVVGFMIKDRFGQSIYGTNTSYYEKEILNLQSGDEFEVEFSFNCNIGPGHYSIAIAMHEGESHLVRNFEWRDRAAIFTVINMDKKEFVGVSWLSPVIEVTR